MADSTNYHEDNKALVTKTKQHDRKLLEQIIHIRVFQEKLQKHCDPNTRDHNEQLGLKLELLKELKLLVAVIDSSAVEFQGNPDATVRRSDGYCGQRDEQFQEAEELTPGPYFSLTELKMLMAEHYDRMKEAEDTHGKFLLQERELLQQLQTV